MRILQVSVSREMTTTISGLIDLTKPLLRVVARKGLFLFGVEYGFGKKQKDHEQH